MLEFDDLIRGFEKMGISPGDTIMVHSSYKSLGGVNGGADTVIDALVESVGDNGTVLFPTFNFKSWVDTHYFDVRETASHMGVITELARCREAAVRTPHPLYSFAVLGNRQEEFAACDDVEAVGDNSVFALFHKLNGLIVSIGLDFNSSFTFSVRAIYKAGGYWRRVKKFSGIYVGYDGEPQLKTYSMYVRSTFQVITDIKPAINELIEREIIEVHQLGDASVHTVRANPFYDAWTVIAKNHPEKLYRTKEIHE
ncbi:MAG: AAC(3) family N-acetyltransferase [Anaerolineales bacterium]